MHHHHCAKATHATDASSRACRFRSTRSVAAGSGCRTARTGSLSAYAPPLNADERTTLQSWLDFHRATLAIKCQGPDDEQGAAASVPPSGLSLA